MGKGIWLGAGLGLVALAGVASAQVPPPGPPPGQGGVLAGQGAPPPGQGGPPAAGDRQPDGMRHGPREGAMMGRPGMEAHMGPHMGWMHRMMEMRRPPESKAAHFRLRKGDAVVDIKCADDESTKACVDSAAALIGALPK